MALDLGHMMNRSDEIWEESILPSLSEFIEIKALSPLFEPKWAEIGELDATIELFCQWLDSQGIEGLSYQTHRIENLSPVLLVTIEGTGPGEVIFYSHLDKQPSKPELWSEGLHPLKAVRRDPWLFGRGSVDDGYGGYLCATSVRLLQEAGEPHPRCTMIIETCEESGSFDLPPYLEALTEQLGDPDMVVVMDSGGPDYDHIWMTEALRGLVSGTLSVKVSNEGIHSGNSGGSIPSSFRIQRILLDRVEDSATGRVLIPEMHVEISQEVMEKASALTEIVGNSIWEQFPTVDTLKQASDTTEDMIIAMNWEPTLSIIGADGIPSVQDAGNVLRTNTDLKLSFRIPPGVDSQSALERAKETLEDNPPYGAEVTFTPDSCADGFHAPPLEGYISEAIQKASTELTGLPPLATWTGGTIPFMAMMQGKYPESMFLCTGASGPGNNAHGPDEKLHIPSSKRLTVALSATIAAISQTP
ncbi:MAG: peptidase M20 [Euryarchaeota archaeon]|nr:peptidase M20 [Euryarchaeota archaeon]|tara:strand:- start:1735 stop:3153 length:1419 start_codon:yes stop_codon:yes gene_type:complete